jgi:ribose transport system ATP-binding protein
MVIERPSPQDARLLMQGVSKAFGATIALNGVDLAVRSGEVHALVGENGAGKSTLMKILSGAHLPDTGQMWLDGQPYRPANPLEARTAGVAMIYQELSLAPHLSVEENIMLGMEPATFGVVRWKEVRRRAIEATAEFEHPDLVPDAQVNKLSVGSQQLVEIARALAIGCRVLVLDEPTSSLTQQDVKRLFDIIWQLKKQGRAIVYISHFIEEVKQIADKVTVLRDGQVVGVSEVAAISTDEIIELMVGRQVKELYPRTQRKAGEIVLEVEGLAGLEKPSSASLQLRRGEVLGLAGLVGAGRTELLRSLFGLAAVRKGSIRLAAYVGPYSPAQRWAQGMGMVSEDRKVEGLAVSLSIADNMTLSRMPFLVSPSWQDTASKHWIRQLSVHCQNPRQQILNLSGGNQQKIALARLLHHNVDVLLLDEPTRGIDVGSKAQIYQIIDKLACEGKAILMVSSYLPELLGICDKVAVMCRGVLGRAVPVEEINEHQIMLEATGSGEAA